MNAYQARKTARVERMRERADTKSAEAVSARAAADRIAGGIPLGQPILIGHHSERRHRRDLKRINAGHEKSWELTKEAQDLRRRADSAEDNRMISSDDPEAAAKLQARIEELEGARKKMRVANAIIRSGRDVTARLVEAGFTAALAAELQEKDPMGRVGFADYQFTNTGSEISRLTKRLEAIQAAATAPPKEPLLVGSTRVVEEENRVRIFFAEKPGDDMRARLKGRGFRWAPSSGAWQRQATAAAWYDAKSVLGAT